MRVLLPSTRLARFLGRHFVHCRPWLRRFFRGKLEPSTPSGSIDAELARTPAPMPFTPPAVVDRNTNHG